MPSVSIIIPCYNNANYISEAIESALAQTYVNCEIIVIDDGSTDSSVDEIKRFGAKVQLVRQQNAGACVARNSGLLHSSGEYIKFLDGDDLLESNCVAEQVASIKEMGIRSSDAVFGDALLLYPQSGRIVPHSKAKMAGLSPGSRLTFREALMFSPLISSPLYPRLPLIEAKGFDSNIFRGQENDLNVRLYLGGINFYYAPCDCFRYRQHRSTTRISVANYNRTYTHNPRQFNVLVSRVINSIRHDELDINREILAKYAWKIGRKFVVSGQEDDAKEYFKIARNLGGSGAVYGGKYYRALLAILGPSLTEKMISALRKKHLLPGASNGN